MPTARDVADCFLAIATANADDGEVLTHLKLQKLLYYAQGFHLAIYGRRLFDESIEAWDHGPVVRSVWLQYRHLGRNPLPPPENADFASLSDEQRELLADVWNAYGQFSAWKLRNMTHDEPPWKEAYAAGVNCRIPDNALKRYFVTQLADA